MPDLNITDPDVLRDAQGPGLLAELGVSGFRVDSLPFMIETIGTSGKDSRLPTCARWSSFSSAAAAMPSSSAGNVSPQEQQGYFAVDSGDGVQMLFDFRTCAPSGSRTPAAAPGRWPTRCAAAPPSRAGPVRQLRRHPRRAEPGAAQRQRARGGLRRVRARAGAPGLRRGIRRRLARCWATTSSGSGWCSP